MFGLFSSCSWPWMTEFVYSQRATPMIRSMAPVRKITVSLFLFIRRVGFDILYYDLFGFCCVYLRM